MRSLWIQVVLFFVYAVLLFFVSRIIDLVLWYNQGMPSTQIVDPLLLSVRQLKQLLENRGVSYTGYIEKKELAQLAEETAHIVQGEVDELSHSQNGQGGDTAGRDRLPVPPPPSYFTGGAHFYEEVEDTKDSVWLVQVVPAGNNEPLLDDYSWRVVCNHVAPLAIRTGIFDCKLDRRLCSSKGWHHPLLLLALPKGTRAKDKVILKTFSATRPQSIIEWVRDQLSIRVKTVENLQELEEQWLNENITQNSPSWSKRGVKVLLLTHLLHPPLFLAALSIKFTGRIKFGMFSVKKHDPETLKKIKQMDVKVPSYIVITPERKIIYGKRKFEHFNFDSMNRFLRAVQPEMNDTFLLSLSFVNLLVILQIFQVSVHRRWKHIARCIWTLISYNFWLFVIWLIILAICRFSIVNFATDKCLVLVRFISLSDIGSLVRSDWQLLQSHPSILILSLFFYGALSAWLLRSRCPDEPVTPSEPNQPWWEVLPVDSYWINCLFRPMATLSRPLPPSELELEEGIEMLIERLAVPNLWLHPVIPTEYIKDLPVWKFRGWDIKKSKSYDKKDVKEITCDSPEILQRLMDYEDPSSGNRVNYDVCKNCMKEKLKIRHANTCNNKHPNRGLLKVNNCVGGTSSVDCVNKPSSTSRCSDRQRRNKISEPTCSIPSEVIDCCNCEILTSADPLPMYKCDSEVEHRFERDCSTGVSEDSSDESCSVPSGMLPTSECAVCLESYAWGSLLCGLPCGHSYHQTCIMLWLQRDNHHCPVCRWPAYKNKISSAHLHRE
ncbi:E3 ubiquitin-protein ligase RNF181 homolog [Gryllus bimaculatus]|nr:E3 ubiquitin-protein ligase RNF181 homolog [Gryllus bimaculatus]